MKYTKEILSLACSHSNSISGVLRYIDAPLNSGGIRQWIKKRILMWDIDISHFSGRGSNSGESHKGGPNKLGTHEILIVDRRDGLKEKSGRLREALVEYGRKYECATCGNGGSWNERELVLEINHINGNNLDNTPENLEFLCPNCHSQVPVYYNQKKKVCMTCQDCGSPLGNRNTSGFCSNCWIYHINKQ